MWALVFKKSHCVHSNQICEHASEHCSCCWVQQLKSETCSFDVAGVESACLSTDDRFRANHGDELEVKRTKICDFVVFCEVPGAQFVIPCEMKGARPDVDYVGKQLQTGATIAEHVLTDFPTPRFFGLLVSSKMLKPEARKRLGSIRVSFRGKRYPVRWALCGSKLRALL
jgi:hypothetical protein